MKNKLTIHVVGLTGSGKSILADKLSKFLRLMGYNVNHPNDDRILPVEAIQQHILNTEIDIHEVLVNRRSLHTSQKPSNSTSIKLREYITTSNLRGHQCNQVLFLDVHEDLADYKIRRIFTSTIIIQETNIPDYYFIHKNRWSDSDIVLTSAKLIDLLKTNYELK
jgi:hypothetical protein